MTVSMLTAVSRAMKHPSTCLAGLAACLIVVSACEGAEAYNCAQRCEADREYLETYSIGAGTTAQEREAMCRRTRITDAQTKCECSDAYAEEFQILPNDLKCSCPNGRESLVVRTESCAVDIVTADDDNCEQFESPAYKLHAFGCHRRESNTP